MFHLRLIKGLSYDGAIHATREDPDAFTDDEVIADYAVASGYFKLIGASGEVPAEPAQETPSEKPDFEALAAMTKAGLITFAEQHEIDLTGCRVKGDILKAISVAYGGAPTMIELQKE